MKSRGYLKYFFIALLLIGAGYYFLNSRKTIEETPGKYDSFAQCLTEKDIKMYGAYWCSHCKSQKEKFGSSWQYINYIECSLPGGEGQKEVCKEAGIRGYPTWDFPDGTRIEGEASFEQLSEKSGCEL